MVYLAKGGFWVSFGQAVSSILSLGLIIAFANLLPKEIYGTYKYILSITSMLNIFTLTGMNQAVTRAVASGKEGILKTSVKYQLKWNILMLLAFWALGAYYYTKSSTILATSFFILSIFSPLYQAFGTYGAYLEGKGNFRLNNIYSIISTFIYAAGMLVAILLSGEIVWLIVAYAMTTSVSSIIFYISTIRKFNPPSENDKETLKYGRELTYIGFIGPVVSQIDKIILTHFWGATQLAAYAIAMAIPERALGFVKDWVNIGFPKFSNKTIGEINEVFNKRMLQGFLFGIVLFLGYIVISPYLFRYFLPQYLDSILYSQILAISFIFAIPGRYVGLLFASQKLTKVIFANSLAQSILRIALYLVLGIWGGIMGLVVAQVIMYILGLLINILIWKNLKDSPSAVTT
jgi:O-antigen/teichoic acid export membrane protein